MTKNDLQRGYKTFFLPLCWLNCFGRSQARILRIQFIRWLVTLVNTGQATWLVIRRMETMKLEQMWSLVFLDCFTSQNYQTSTQETKSSVVFSTRAIRNICCACSRAWYSALKPGRIFWISTNDERGLRWMRHDTLDASLVCTGISAKPTSRTPKSSALAPGNLHCCKWDNLWCCT